MELYNTNNTLEIIYNIIVHRQLLCTYVITYYFKITIQKLILCIVIRGIS